MVKKRAEDTKSARTRERILESAAYVLSQKGFAGTRLTDVADHAQLQAPAIYYYFKSREELIEEVMVVGVSRIRDHVANVLESLPASTGPVDRVLAAVEAHLRFTLTESAYTLAATRNGGQLPEPLRDRHESLRIEYGNIWRDLFIEAQKAGVIAPDTDLGMARMLTMGAMNWAVEWWKPQGASVDVLIATAQRMLTSGLFADTATPPKARSRTKKTPAKRTTRPKTPDLID